ncbi:MAG: RsmD family RNA methyltransferase [Synergistaceae bacterium]|jgi:16S rRNA (guanine(966)-N(2))-methyltransferase RsmD|nr:RsmD family RNA methyltransferase [Synergistaceae bacterium]
MKDVRPTSGKVLLALFSILGSVEGMDFLDLFAGTGRVGMEALKRGASSVVWVEAVKDRSRAIAQAVPAEFEDRGVTTVLSLELRRGAAWLVRRGLVFDVVFADPPYHEGWGESLLRVGSLTKILKKGGIMIVERSSREELAVPEPWAVTENRVYGETALTFLRLKAFEFGTAGAGALP